MSKTSPGLLFDKNRIDAVRNRAKFIGKTDADFLANEAAINIAERLSVTNRQFDLCIDLFSPIECMAHSLQTIENIGNVHQISFDTNNTDLPVNVLKPDTTATLESLPFAKHSVNLITSVFGLHWSNHLSGMLGQIETALAPDGLFMAALPGQRTLQELRDCLLRAEANLNGNASLRVDPFGEVRQLGNLLQHAGFSLPVADSELLTVRYDSMFDLVDDLRAMGATSTLLERPGFGPRHLFDRAAEIYSSDYSDPDHRIRATFEIVYLSGWAPHGSQQQPLKPGSAQKRLSDFF